ncbi:MAG: alpha-amylase family glycosyl hydrolase [Leeuwenhoekiella sp.]
MGDITKVEGMGAIIVDEGVAFRVWAPNAHKVFVVGDFNEWHNDENELFSEDNGYWYTLVKNAEKGQEYKYYIVNGEMELYKIDPYAREVTNSNGNGVIAELHFDWSVTDFKIPSWNSLVIYELHIGTFFRKYQDQVGDFDSVTSHLTYLKALGINCIELMPVAEFPGGQSWGYNPSLPFAIEQDYGGQYALAKLIDEAHKLGIAVIMDVVYNHFGPSDLDLWQFDGWSENDGGGIYFYNDWKADTPWGSTRPDYGREEVRRYIRDNAFMWLERFNCDGLRWDATAFIREADGGLGMENTLDEGVKMMQDINSEVHDKYPEKLLIAEDLMKKEYVTNAAGYGGLGFNTQWDANFVHPLRKLLSETQDSDRDMQIVADVLSFSYNDKPFQRVVYVESHDEVANGKVRLPEMIQPGEADSAFAKKRAVLGAVVVLTAPGIPMLFQGQEFLSDKFFKDDDGLDWEKFSKFKGITKLFRDIIKLRTGHDGSAWGLQSDNVNVFHLNNQDKILAYYRYSNDAKDRGVIVILNFSNQQFGDYQMGIPEGGKWTNKINTSWKGYDWQFDDAQVGDFETFDEAYDEMQQSTKLNIPAYAALIYTR